MFDYSEARATAEALIGEFGESASLIRKGNDAGFDVNTGDPIPAVPDYQIDGVVTPLLSYKSTEVDGELIQTGDSYCFFHSTEAPVIGMSLTINGHDWRVVSIVDLTSVEGVNVFRKLQLRR